MAFSRGTFCKPSLLLQSHILLSHWHRPRMPSEPGCDRIQQEESTGAYLTRDCRTEGEKISMYGTFGKPIMQSCLQFEKMKWVECRRRKSAPSVSRGRSCGRLKNGSETNISRGFQRKGEIVSLSRSGALSKLRQDIP